MYEGHLKIKHNKNNNRKKQQETRNVLKNENRRRLNGWVFKRVMVLPYIYVVTYMTIGRTTLVVSHIKNIAIVYQKEATLLNIDTSSVFIRS